MPIDFDFDGPTLPYWSHGTPKEVHMSFRLFFSSFFCHTCLLFDLRIVGKEDMVPRGQAL